MLFIYSNRRFIVVKLFKVPLIQAVTFYFNADFATCIFMAFKSRLAPAVLKKKKPY